MRNNKKKYTKNSIIGLVIAIVLMIASFISIILSSITIFSEIDLSSDYDKSYNMRVELDVSAYANEKGQEGIDKVTELVNETADSYSKWLSSQGNANFLVYPEVVVDGEGDQQYVKQAFLSTTVQNETYIDHHDNMLDNPDGIEKDIPKQQIYFNNLESSRLSVLLAEPSGTTTDVNYVVNDTLSSQISFDMVDKDGIQHIKTDDTNYLYVPYISSSPKPIFQTMREKIVASQTNNLGQDIVYILKNEQELIDYLNYAIGVYDENRFDLDASNEWKALPADVQEWLLNKQNKYSQEPLTVSHSNIVDAIDRLESDGNVPRDGLVDAGFMNEYVVGTVHNEIDSSSGDDSEDSSSNPSNLSQVFPTELELKDLLPKDEKIKVKTDDVLLLNPSNLFQTNKLKEQLVEMSFAIPVKSLSEGSSPSTIANKIQIEEQQPKYANSIFGSSSIISTIIVLVIVLLMIGILVSVLYRIPGFIGWICLLNGICLTMLTMTMLKYMFSIATFVALIIGIVASSIILISILEKMKKRFKFNEDVDAIVVKVFKNTIWQSFDISAILLIFGLVFIYFSHLITLEFGLLLVFYSLISFGTNAILYWAITFSGCFNKFSLNKKLYFQEFSKISKKNSNKVQVQTLNNNGDIETSYYTSFQFSKVNLVSKYTLYGFGIILLILFVGGLIWGLVGFINAPDFSNGTRLVISFDGRIVDIDALMKSINDALFNGSDGGWYSISYINLTDDAGHSTATLYLQTNMIIQSSIANNALFLSKIYCASSISIETINAIGNIDFANDILITLLILSAFLTIYSCLRLNWISIIVVFVSTTIIPLSIVCLAALFFINIDVVFVYAMILVYAINMCYVFVILGNLNNKWSRHKIYTPEHLKFIINSEIKSSFQYWVLVNGMLVIISLLFMLFLSTSMIYLGLGLFIGLLVITLIEWWFTPNLIYGMLYLRSLYVNKVLNNESDDKLVNKYDQIDEQLIEGINKFTKLEK